MISMDSLLEWFAKNQSLVTQYPLAVATLATSVAGLTAGGSLILAKWHYDREIRASKIAVETAVEAKENLESYYEKKLVDLEKENQRLSHRLELEKAEYPYSQWKNSKLKSFTLNLLEQVEDIFYRYEDLKNSERDKQSQRRYQESKPVTQASRDKEWRESREFEERKNKEFMETYRRRFQAKISLLANELNCRLGDRIIGEFQVEPRSVFSMSIGGEDLSFESSYAGTIYDNVSSVIQIPSVISGLRKMVESLPQD